MPFQLIAPNTGKAHPFHAFPRGHLKALFPLLKKRFGL